MIAAIILAAGQSKRMGTAKMLLPFGKKTIIESVIDSVRQSAVGKVLVVLGADRKKLERKVGSLQIEVTHNPQYSTGMLSSVQHGFSQLKSDVEASIVVLGDQPSLSPSTIDHLIDAYKHGNKGIVLPVYRGRRGHPILIDMKYKEAVQQLNPHIGLRELIRSHADDIFEVEVGTESILQDIDTPTDYDRETKDPNGSP